MEEMFTHSPRQERTHLIILFVVIVLLGSVFPFMMQSSVKGSPDFAAAVNLFGSLLAVIAGLALVAHYSSLRNPIDLFLGLAFFLGGTMDMVNGLMTFAMVHEWTELPAKWMDTYLVATYVGGRLLMGMILLLAPALVSRSGDAGGRPSLWVSLMFLVLCALASVLIFQMAAEGVVRPNERMPRPVDFFLGLLFLAAFLILLAEYHRRRDMLTWWVACAVGICAIAQFVMTWSRAPNDFYYSTAHAYKALGYMAPLVGFPLCQIATAVERRRALDALAEQRSIFRTVLANTPDLIALKDLRFIYQAANSAFCDFLGKDEEEIVGRDDFDLYPEERARRYRRSDKEVASTGQSLIQDEQFITSEGKRHLHVLRAPVRDGAGNLIALLSSVRDITGLKELEERLRLMSITDELTRIYNRRGFLAMGEQMLKQAKRSHWRAVLLFLDLDNLKHMNDVYGHPEGDRALVTAARALGATLREADVTARVGGDEFVGLALDTTEATERELRSRLEANLRALEAESPRPCPISFSCGVAHYDPDHPISLQEMMEVADKLMYAEKQAKKRPKTEG